MPEYLQPGVYVEEASIGAQPIDGIATSTSQFLEALRSAPLDALVRSSRLHTFQQGFCRLDLRAARQFDLGPRAISSIVQAAHARARDRASVHSAPITSQDLRWACTQHAAVDRNAWAIDPVRSSSRPRRFGK